MAEKKVWVCNIDDSPEGIRQLIEEDPEFKKEWDETPTMPLEQLKEMCGPLPEEFWENMKLKNKD